jgi:hypothetical protein
VEAMALMAGTHEAARMTPISRIHTIRTCRGGITMALGDRLRQRMANMWWSTEIPTQICTTAGTLVSLVYGLAVVMLTRISFG